LDFRWDIFWNYLWPPSAFQNPLIETGFMLTILLAVTAETVGVLLGLVGALALLSKRRAIRAIATVYVTYFRGTPVIVQLALVYFGAAAIGLYGFEPKSIAFITLTGAIQAGILTLGLNEGAYMTEIIRAGIISVDAGQMEAARAIGMTYRAAMRWIVLPQAIRVILPPFGNNFNGMMKSTSLVITIGALELFGAYQQVNGVLFDPFELFLACSFYYLALTIVWSWIQGRLERRFGSPDQQIFKPRTDGFRLRRRANGKAEGNEMVHAAGRTAS
jgi:polar amino acid transport system permease protein